MTDLSDTYFLIGIGTGCVVILDYSEEWREFDIEHHWEDTFINDAPEGLSPGAYRYTGFTVGSWDEGEMIELIGGEFIPFMPEVSHA